MKLSKDTLAVLNNFSKISGGLFIRRGNVLKTRATAVYAEATVVEDFPLEFAILDLSDFLRTIALFKDPVLDFTAEHIHIAEVDGAAELDYGYAETGMVLPCPNLKSWEIPADHLNFVITEEQWNTLQKALGLGVIRRRSEAVMGFMNVRSDGKSVRIGTQKYREPSEGEYFLRASGDPCGYQCNMVFNAHNLPLLPGFYEVAVMPDRAHFKHTSRYSLRYFVAPEPVVSKWGSKRLYQVRVTKGTTQDCLVSVQAHSTEEAEAIVRQLSDKEFTWAPESRPVKDCRVVG